jgi:Flp pilus assembly protein TadB
MMAVVIVSAAVIVLSHVCLFWIKKIHSARKINSEMSLQLTEDDHYLQINSEIDSQEKIKIIEKVRHLLHMLFPLCSLEELAVG